MSQMVRRAEITDHDLLVTMMREFYAESGTPFPEEQANQAFSELLRDKALGRIWVLERNGVAVGYAVLTLGYSMEYGGRDAFIDDLFVRREHRGCGLGRAAMKAIVKECRARQVRALHLEVARENIEAKKLYGQFGFRDYERQLMTVHLNRVDTSA